MSTRTKRRAEQRRMSSLERKPNELTGVAKPATSKDQSAHATPLGALAMHASTVPPTGTGTSPAQIAANRQNALNSTGPTSEAGRAAVSQNRTVHGLNYNPATFRVLACEDQAQYDALLNNLVVDHKPANTTETLLVTAMAQHHWLLDRANRLQESAFDQQTGEIKDQKLFSLYLRYATTHERAFHKCLSDLLKLRFTMQKLEIGFESERRRVDRHKDFLDGKEFELKMKQTRLTFLDLDLQRAERIAAREEKAQNAA